MNNLCEELNPPTSDTEKTYSWFIIICILNAFLSHSTIMLNSVTLYAMWKVSSLSKQLKTLLLNLVVTDLCVGLIVQPLFIAVLLLEKTSCTLYTFFIFFTGLLSSASLFGVTALSLDRFLAIHLHLRYQELVTHRRVAAAVILVWIFSALLSLLGLLIPRDVIMLIFAAKNFVCIMLTTVVFAKLFAVLRRFNHQVQPQISAPNFGQMANEAPLKNSTMVALYIYLVFLFCYVPQTAQFVVSGVAISLSYQTETVFAFNSWALVFLNSALNPIIFCWKMRDIRRAVLNVLQSMYQSCKSS